MKFVHLKAVVGAMALSVALAGTAQAQVVLADITSGTSDDTKVNIGVSNVPFGPHRSDRVGISVPSLQPNDFFVDFQGLQTASPPVNGVTSIHNPTGTVTDHSQYGRFDIAKVDGQNLYFGEWSQTANVAAGDHTVYYAGTGGTSVGNIPTSTSATYNLKGVSDYQNKGLLEGQLNVTFTSGGNGSLTSGFLDNGVGSASTYKVDLGSASITAGVISGSSAVASNPSTSTTLASLGTVDGRFFGSSAQAVAGIVTFRNVSTDRQYDTAFGGTQ